MPALAKNLDQLIANEKRTVTSLENAYMKHGRQKTYIALEEIDFVWCVKEIERFRRMWSAGYDIWKIAEQLGRSVHDVVMLVYDHHLNEKIETRKGAIFGWHTNTNGQT